ncbi:DUF2243 domain-containing protein [Auraticoccus sp. F435]|uniref:DUF2243 domain-containing protein n=1 Tax=Auraticoccus cholistanensis TaxID=2656650 RepID=A0A6A9V0B2_9ACTN|nr:DUF2243 domain-containing protein [Auraticoccus cholistanensis]MVA75289.1 DUF2243 domain-containing protein [Auraticoccus cholistanensis]
MTTAEPARTPVRGAGASAGGPDRRTVLSGVLFGCGVAASMIDLVVFHLGLQWHHFYDRSTTRVALVSDGVLHALSWSVTVWGLFLLADVRRRGEVSWRRWTAAVVTGVGAFQLFDGVVDHKLLRVHQIRYGVDLLPYDAVWIATSAVVLVAGLLLLRRSRPGRRT